MLQRFMQCTIILSLCGLALQGCITAPMKPYIESTSEVPAQVYSAKYEDVWQAAHIAMLKYRLRIDNVDAGIMETESVSESPFYRPPFRLSSTQSGRRYIMELRFIKGVVKGKQSTRVSVYKIVEKQSSIVDEPEQIASDGWEEHALLYRIHRELTIHTGLQRYQSRLEKNQKDKVAADIEEGVTVVPKAEVTAEVDSKTKSNAVDSEVAPASESEKTDETKK